MNIIVLDNTKKSDIPELAEFLKYKKIDATIVNVYDYSYTHETPGGMKLGLAVENSEKGTFYLSMIGSNKLEQQFEEYKRGKQSTS